MSAGVRPAGRLSRPAIMAACGLLIAACSDVNRAAPSNPLDAPPVDTERIRLVDAIGWPHRRIIEIDLDGDGDSERLVLTSDVTLNDAGVPIWEDGHRWAAFVEDAGERTLIYGAFVPNGRVEAAVLTADSQEQRRHVYVRERTPQQERALVLAYDGPGAARAVSAAHYQVEGWIPALAP